MRELNEKQHVALERMSEGDPAAIVVSWEDSRRGTGPVVLTSTDKLLIFHTNGRVRAWKAVA